MVQAGTRFNSGQVHDSRVRIFLSLTSCALPSFYSRPKDTSGPVLQATVPAPRCVTSDSDFSTRAYAGSSSSRAASTPTQGDFPPTSPNPEANGDADPAVDAGSNTWHSDPHSGPDTTESNSPSEARPISDGSASTAHTTIDPTDSAPVERRVYPGVVPIPSVAPFASVLTSTGVRLAIGVQPTLIACVTQVLEFLWLGVKHNHQHRAFLRLPHLPNKGVQFVLSPMSESSPSPKGSGLGASIKRFASLRSRRDKKGAGVGAGAAPPSSFVSPMHGHARGGSVDSSRISSPASPASPVVSASSPKPSAATDSSTAQPNDTVAPKPSRDQPQHE
ncbi:hypothetical protein B0H19DRAFT_1245408 [Mycena capillaripes]|nr:hypothetical protein B0H19DRAFT_1245408 [Mycena capillaripes]